MAFDFLMGRRRAARPRKRAIPSRASPEIHQGSNDSTRQHAARPRPPAERPTSYVAVDVRCERGGPVVFVEVTDCLQGDETSATG